jgi:hypothetical protein
MIRKFKALGLALVAVFAMSAVVASAAQATAGTLTSEGKSVVITAEQVGEHELVLTSHETEPGKYANVKCKKATFTGTGTLSEGATTVRAHPEYKECSAFGQAATITTTGCDHVLHTGTTTGFGGWKVTTDIDCATTLTGDLSFFTHVIKIVTGTCEVWVEDSQNQPFAEVTNSGGAGTAMDLQLHSKLIWIEYRVVKDNIGCPLKGVGFFFDGDYTGTTTVKAHDSTTKAAVGITFH